MLHLQAVAAGGTATGTPHCVALVPLHGACHKPFRREHATHHAHMQHSTQKMALGGRGVLPLPLTCACHQHAPPPPTCTSATTCAPATNTRPCHRCVPTSSPPSRVRTSMSLSPEQSALNLTNFEASGSTSVPPPFGRRLRACRLRSAAVTN
eukprot:361670-Chlamydomonas_euryale.AAC.8